MIFHIAVCSPDAGLRSGLERQCMEFFARRADACIVEHLPDTDALLRKDGEGVRYDLYLLELSGSAAPVGLAAAGELRRRGRRAHVPRRCGRSPDPARHPGPCRCPERPTPTWRCQTSARSRGPASRGHPGHPRGPGRRPRRSLSRLCERCSGWVRGRTSRLPCSRAGTAQRHRAAAPPSFSAAAPSVCCSGCFCRSRCFCPKGN